MLGCSRIQSDTLVDGTKQKYIDAYDEKYGSEYEGVLRPEKYSKMTKENQGHSDVFNFFKFCFDDLGSWDTGGINWFINGDRQHLISCSWQEFHGFFSKVFSKDDVIAKETRDTSKETFNLWFKNAFRYNQAIGFAAYDLPALIPKAIPWSYGERNLMPKEM